MDAEDDPRTMNSDNEHADDFARDEPQRSMPSSTWGRRGFDDDATKESPFAPPYEPPTPPPYTSPGYTSTSYTSAGYGSVPPHEQPPVAVPDAPAAKPRRGWFAVAMIASIIGALVGAGAYGIADRVDDDAVGPRSTTIVGR
jgi:hypothetical protein